MIVSKAAVLGIVLALGGVQSADAATFIYTGTFSGTVESPPHASLGTGTTTVIFNDITNLLSIEANFAGLTGATTVAHIHCCAFPTTANAGVATTTPSFAGFPTGVTSGNFFQVLDLSATGSFNPTFLTANGGTTALARTALVAGLDRGQAYFNIHTSAFRAGEIRADLVPAIPEPATWLMMIVGFGAIGGAMRVARRKQPVAFIAA